MHISKGYCKVICRRSMYAMKKEEFTKWNQQHGMVS